MAASCFQKPNSDPPICGIHYVPLIPTKLLIDPNAPHLGHNIGYVCPRTHEIVADLE
jgi:hypothetical protein